MTNEALFSIWRKMTRVNQFDEQVHKAVADGRVRCFVYLSSGQEAIAASVAESFDGYKPAIFGQHRAHGAYISFGGDVKKLRDELLQPYGGDPMIHDREIRLYGHSGLVADQVPIAVGYAYATRAPVICFCGDSTVEEDVFWPAAGFAVTHRLPVLFIVENNGLSVITRVETRRLWEVCEVARGFGLGTDSIMDDPRDIHRLVGDFVQAQSPTLLEIVCCRKYRHVGIGVDAEMAWDRMAMVREWTRSIDPDRAERIEFEAQREMSELWEIRG